MHIGREKWFFIFKIDPRDRSIACVERTDGPFVQSAFAISIIDIGSLPRVRVESTSLTCVETAGCLHESIFLNTSQSIDSIRVVHM